MNKRLEIIAGFRRNLINQIENLSVEQLNKIPVHFNNNIIWNLGHMLTVEQNMCYARAALPFTVDEKYISPFLPGGKPDNLFDSSTITAIKELLLSSILQLDRDMNSDIFKSYSPSVMIPKVYGFEINNIDDAVSYLLYHDGLHAGQILAIKRLV